MTSPLSMPLSADGLDLGLSVPLTLGEESGRLSDLIRHPLLLMEQFFHSSLSGPRPLGPLLLPPGGNSDPGSRGRTSTMRYVRSFSRRYGPEATLRWKGWTVSAG